MEPNSQFLLTDHSTPPLTRSDPLIAPTVILHERNAVSWFVVVLAGAVIKQARRGARDGVVLPGPGAHGVESIIVGYYKASELIYVARVRNGFVPEIRRQVFGKLRLLVVADCPFVNLLKHTRVVGEPA